MTTELLALIAAYFACSDLAEERHLTRDEVDTCNAVYQNVKLSFVPGVEPHDYVQLSARERHAVNQAGFRAFRAWQADNPDTVQHLERVARGKEDLNRGG